MSKTHGACHAARAEFAQQYSRQGGAPVGSLRAWRCRSLTRDGRTTAQTLIPHTPYGNAGLGTAHVDPEHAPKLIVALARCLSMNRQTDTTGR
jgi:hypothetical protein